jgi:uncharacterized cupredoxin-like copper-binding protein
MSKEKSMRRAAALIASGVLGMAALVGCSSDSNTDTTSAGGVTVPSGATGTSVAVTAGDKSDTEQFLTVEPASVKAGSVTFTLTNTGTKKHEMVVLKTDEPFAGLAVGADHRVSEDTSAGEVGETDPGKSGTVTLDLQAGKYVLVCNIEKHYEQGMRVGFTVTG